MKKIYNRFKNDKKVVFLAVQTVFEGHYFNTKEKLVPTQKKFNLPIPMGHDDSNYSKKHPIPITMATYRTGGTPWVVIIDPKGKVVYNQFHIEEQAAIKLINGLISN